MNLTIPALPDVFTPAKRSEVMSKIRGRGNLKTEMAMVRLLRANHLHGWRRHANVFGRPDFVFPKIKLAIFVDGCFWHACPKHANLPVGNRAFWKAKLLANQNRDRVVNRTLRARGWRVLRVWEHELKAPPRLLAKIRRGLNPLL